VTSYRNLQVKNEAYLPVSACHDTEFKLENKFNFILNILLAIL